MGITITEIQKYIRDSVFMGIENGLQRDHSMLKYFAKTGPSNAKGPQYKVKVTGNGSVKSGFTVGGALNTPGSADSVQVQMPWGNYSGGISISHRGMLQIMQSEGDGTAQIDDQIGWQIDDLVEEILDAMNTDAISGTEGSVDASTIVGLVSQLTDTGTKGGVNIGTYPGVGCYVNDNGGGGNRTLTKAILDTAFNEAVHENFKVRWDAPNYVAFAHHTIVDAIKGLSSDNAVTLYQTQTGEGGVIARIGEDAVSYNGAMVVKIPGYTQNRLDFVHRDELALELLGWDPSMYDGAGGFAGLEKMDAVKHDVQGDTDVFNVFAYAQLRVRNCAKKSFSIQEIAA